MPINIPETDKIWNKVYNPVIKKCKLAPRRVDKHDDGSSLHAQIVNYLNNSSLIIADLTFARPNCYFEVGYAMAHNRNIIICCREDHSQDSPNYDKDKYKVHFDLQTYSIIWWNNSDLGKFKVELESKINFRKKLIKSIPVTEAHKAKFDPKKLDEMMLKAGKELRKTTWKKRT